MSPPLSLWPWLLPSGLRETRATWREIAREVARKHGLSFEELLGPGKAYRVSHPRQELMWRMHRELGLSTVRIGQLLGERDHSTVSHGIRRHEERIATEIAA
jgi:chromosomal replication initiator protein